MYVWSDKFVIKRGVVYFQKKDTPVNGYIFNRREEEKITSNGSYVNGIRDGTHSYELPLFDNYSNERCVFKETLYQMGIRVKEEVYYPFGTVSCDGKLKERYYLKNDKKDGPTEGFHQNGQLSFSGQYEKGSRVGTWEFFYKNGESKGELEYQ